MSKSLLKIIGLEIFDWADDIIRFIPGRIGYRIRALWMEYRLASLGKLPNFGIGIVVTGANNISIGDYFSMMRYGSMYCEGGTLQIGNRVATNQNVLLGAGDGGSIFIGNDVLIGANVIIRASNHVFERKDKHINQQGQTGGRIVVGDDVWIAANVVVLPNVTIGAHSVIAAGAVVTNDVEPWTVVGGVPAQIISRR